MATPSISNLARWLAEKFHKVTSTWAHDWPKALTVMPGSAVGRVQLHRGPGRLKRKAEQFELDWGEPQAFALVQQETLDGEQHAGEKTAKGGRRETSRAEPKAPDMTDDFDPFILFSRESAPPPAIESPRTPPPPKPPLKPETKELPYTICTLIAQCSGFRIRGVFGYTGADIFTYR